MSTLPQPSPEVGVKLASLVMHADEALGPNGHEVDREVDRGVFRVLFQDESVQEYLRSLDGLALLPLRRDA